MTATAPRNLRTLPLPRGSSQGHLLGLGWLPLAALLGCQGEASVARSYEPPEASEQEPGGDTTNDLLFGSKAFTMPLRNATKEHEALFFSGNSFFNSAWVEAPSSTAARDGLGPLFNARNCSGCHFEDGRGSPPLEEGESFVGVLFRIGTGRRNEDGSPEGDPIYGDQLQPFSLPELAAEARPVVSYAKLRGSFPDGESYELLEPTYAFLEPAYGDFDDDLRVSPRAAPVMIGLGLLEAISERDLQALADPADEDGDGISGKLNYVWDHGAGEKRVGRFGWKAEQPSVRQQVAGAFLGDMGLSTSIFAGSVCSEQQSSCSDMPTGGEPEVDEETFERVVLYSRMLAPPQRQNVDSSLEGRELFRQIGCAECHVPSFETGGSDLEEVAHQKIWPYTDLLLHDMGEDLGDRRPSFEAEGNEWRTPPLWGLGRISVVNGHDRLLHDGRARGVVEAILWHGGEGARARDEFRALQKGERAKLVQFVESL